MADGNRFLDTSALRDCGVCFLEAFCILLMTFILLCFALGLNDNFSLFWTSIKLQIARRKEPKHFFMPLTAGSIWAELAYKVACSREKHLVGEIFFFNGKKKRPWTRKPIVPSNMVFLVALSLKTLSACSNSWENASSGQKWAPCVVREDSVTLSSC